MQSHCLKHQDKVATARCGACSVPLCELCAEHHGDGIYCSTKCYQSVEDGKVRAAKMAAEEEQLRKWRQTRAAYRMVFYVVMICAVVFGWKYLPASVTVPIEHGWKVMKASFSGGK